MLNHITQVEGSLIPSKTFLLRSDTTLFDIKLENDKKSWKQSFRTPKEEPQASRVEEC